MSALPLYQDFDSPTWAERSARSNLSFETLASLTDIGYGSLNHPIRRQLEEHSESADQFIILLDAFPSQRRDLKQIQNLFNIFSTQSYEGQISMICQANILSKIEDLIRFAIVKAPPPEESIHLPVNTSTPYRLGKKNILITLEEVEAYKTKAMRGDAEAQYQLGLLYWLINDIVTQDILASLKYLKMAKDQDHPKAMKMFSTVLHYLKALTRSSTNQQNIERYNAFLATLS